MGQSHKVTDLQTDSDDLGSLSLWVPLSGSEAQGGRRQVGGFGSLTHSWNGNSSQWRDQRG